MQSDSEMGEQGSFVFQGTAQRAPWVRKAGLAAVAGGALLLLAPAASYGRQALQRTGLSFEMKDETLTAVPPRQDCSPNEENCMTSGCCQTSGAKCLAKDASYAECHLECPDSSWQCWESTATYKTLPVVAHPGPSLYCYTVVQNVLADSSHTTNDKELVQGQARNNVGVFQCNDVEVFSDVDIPLENGHTCTKVQDVDGEFHALTRKDKPYKYVNTPLFYQVWKAIRDHGLYLKRDWTVKSDPQTVFIAARLSGFLAGQAATVNGNYYENCMGVDSGYFGNLEVTNKAGMIIFFRNVEECKLSLCWRNTDDCKGDWTYGPWGEDLFMQRCFDRHDVAKLEDFQLAISGSCPHSRPVGQRENKSWVPPCAGQMAPALHPFNTSSKWFGCLGTLTGAHYN